MDQLKWSDTYIPFAQFLCLATPMSPMCRFMNTPDAIAQDSGTGFRHWQCAPMVQEAGYYNMSIRFPTGRAMHTDRAA